jgi:hypothetical protein
LVRSARFYFHKYEIVTLPRHQVDLPGAISRPEIARDDGVPLAAQKPVGQVFTMAAASHVDGRAAHACAVAEAVREAVEKREHIREASRFREDGISRKVAFLGDYGHEF